MRLTVYGWMAVYAVVFGFTVGVLLALFIHQ